MKARWPWVTRCEHCREQVVIALQEGGGTVVLDAVPVLVGVKSCPYCHNVRAAKKRWEHEAPPICHECGSTGVRGEPLDPAVHVVMRITGILRKRVGMVEPWDSAYRRHECEGTQRVCV